MNICIIQLIHGLLEFMVSQWNVEWILEISENQVKPSIWSLAEYPSGSMQSSFKHHICSGFSVAIINNC